MARETTMAITFKDRGTTTATKPIALKTTFKGMLLLPETHQMPASNVEK